MDIKQKTTHRKPKSAEVARLVEVKKKIGATWDALSEKIDVPKRTITNYVYESGQLSGSVLRGMLVHYGVSADWLLSGSGYMFVNNIQEGVVDDAGGCEIKDTGIHCQLADKKMPLFPFLDTIDTNSLQDFFYLTAASIEQSLMQAGDYPGKDYTRIDLYQLAQPFVVERFSAGDIKIALFDVGKNT